MKINRLILTLALVGTALVNISCSSGGDDAPPPTAPTAVFQLFEAGSFTAGYTESTNYTGSDTAGGVWSGNISKQTQPQSTFLGQPAIPVFSLVQLKNSANGAVISNIGAHYWSTSASDRRYLGYSGASTETASAATTAIPETAKIGDFGVIGTYTDNAGSVDVQSWRLDDGTNGQAKIVELSTEKDQSGNLESSSTTTTLIETTGKSISKTLVLFLAGIGETLTLTGS